MNAWYAYGPGSNAVVNRMNVAAGTRATLVTDIQGSVVGSLDSGTGVLTRWGYRPFGENPALSSDSFAYTAQRHDPETAGGSAEPSGLYYDRARMYSPTWGRFLQPDPGDTGATNLYAYVGNDPFNMTDPSGMFAELGENAWNLDTTASTWGHSNFYRGVAENAGQTWFNDLSFVAGGVPSSIADWAGFNSGNLFGAPVDKYDAAGRFTLGTAVAVGSLAAAGVGLAQKGIASARFATEDFAGLLRQNLSRSDLPTAASSAVDRATGNIYYGVSGEIPTEIAPQLADRIPNPSLERWPPMNCAEFNACNKALLNGASLENLNVYTVRTSTGSPFARCANCTITIQGANVLSDRR